MKHNYGKTIFAVCTLLIAVLLTFAGCSGGDDDKNSSKPDSAAATTPNASQSSAAPASSKPSGNPSLPQQSSPVSNPATSHTSGSESTPEEDGLSFYVSGAAGKAGSDVTVYVMASGKDQITGFSFTLGYDAEKLELVSDKCVMDRAGAYAVSNKTVAGKIRLMATTSGDDRLNTKGQIWSVTFHIKDDVAASDIPLTLSLADHLDTVYICVGDDFIDVNCSLTGGSVTVS